MLADAPPGGVFAAMADRRPAVIAALLRDVDLVAAARPVLMRPDLAGLRVHRHALRVAVADGIEFRRPAIGLPGGMRVVVRHRAVGVQPQDAAGMRRRVLRVVAIAAVADAGEEVSPRHLQPAAEMMPGPGRIIAGEDRLALHQSIPLETRAVDGGRGFAAQIGRIAQIDMRPVHHHIQHAALAAGEDLRKAGDVRRAAVGKADALQSAAADRHQHLVGADEIHAPRVGEAGAHTFDGRRAGHRCRSARKKGRTHQRGPYERSWCHRPTAC